MRDRGTAGESGNTTGSARAQTPGWLETYALTYACGALWLLVAVVLLGGRGSFSFDAGYDALLALPPLATALTLLLIDRRGAGRWIVWRALLLAVVCGVVSALSTVLLTPLLVFMFRTGVTGDLSATGIVASVALVVVASPVVVGLVSAIHTRRVGRAVTLAAGVLVAGTVLLMTLEPAGALASSLRLDQAEIVMITSAWWLPAYAIAAAFIRREGLA